jgi:hypothetical protein
MSRDARKLKATHALADDTGPCSDLASVAPSAIPRTATVLQKIFDTGDTPRDAGIAGHAMLEPIDASSVYGEGGVSTSVMTSLGEIHDHSEKTIYTNTNTIDTKCSSLAGTTADTSTARVNVKRGNHPEDKEHTTGTMDTTSESSIKHDKAPESDINPHCAAHQSQLGAPVAPLADSDAVLVRNLIISWHSKLNNGAAASDHAAASLGLMSFAELKRWLPALFHSAMLRTAMDLFKFCHNGTSQRAKACTLAIIQAVKMLDSTHMTMDVLKVTDMVSSLELALICPDDETQDITLRLIKQWSTGSSGCVYATFPWLSRFIDGMPNIENFRKSAMEALPKDLSHADEFRQDNWKIIYRAIRSSQPEAELVALIKITAHGILNAKAMGRFACEGSISPDILHFYGKLPIDRYILKATRFLEALEVVQHHPNRKIRNRVVELLLKWRPLMYDHAAQEQPGKSKFGMTDAPMESEPNYVSECTCPSPQGTLPKQDHLTPIRCFQGYDSFREWAHQFLDADTATMDLIGADLKKLYSSLPWLMDGVLQFSMPNHQKVPIHHKTIQSSGGPIEHEVHILGTGGEDESHIAQLQETFARMMLMSARTVARTSRRDHAAIQEELTRKFTEQVAAAKQKYLIELDRLEKKLKATDQSHTNEQRKLRDRLRQEKKAHGRYFQDVEKGVSEATVHVRGQLAAAKAETALYKKASSEKQQLQDQVSRLEHEMAQIRTAKLQREADLKTLEDETKAVREGYDQLKTEIAQLETEKVELIAEVELLTQGQKEMLAKLELLQVTSKTGEVPPQVEKKTVRSSAAVDKAVTPFDKYTRELQHLDSTIAVWQGLFADAVSEKQQTQAEKDKLDTQILDITTQLKSLTGPNPQKPGHSSGRNTTTRDKTRSNVPVPKGKATGSVIEKQPDCKPFHASAALPSIPTQGRPPPTESFPALSGSTAVPRKKGFATAAAPRILRITNLVRENGQNLNTAQGKAEVVAPRETKGEDVRSNRRHKNDCTEE